MQFSDVLGQESVKRQLICTVQESKISHAQLFLGKEGCGNLPAAIAYAQFILCEDKKESDSCGKCAPCIKMQKLSHPDVNYVFPVATTKDIKKHVVSDKFMGFWREMISQSLYINLFEWLKHIGVENKQGNINVEESAEILKKLSLKTFEAEYKILIIWMPEKLHPSAANKLLKIVEEPPEKTLFIFVTEDQEQILPTILSRTQIIRFKTLTDVEVAEGLKRYTQLDSIAITAISRLAEGNFVRALQLAEENNDQQVNQEKFFEWMRLCYAVNKDNNMLKLTQWVEQIASVGREAQKQFLEFGLHIFRECLMLNFGQPHLVHIPEVDLPVVKRFSPFVNGANGVELSETFNEASYHIERNGNPKLIFLDISLKTAKLIRMK